MDTHKKMREHLSALVDGELPEADLELAMAALHTPDGKQTWETYYRIGDELRAAPAPALSEGFAARLAARLDTEAPPLRRATAKNPDGTSGRRSGARASTSGRGAAGANGTANGTANNTANGAQARHEPGPAAVTEELGADGKAVMLPKPAIASVS